MSAFAAMQLALEDEDPTAFVTSYKSALEACYSCHTASGLPFLRPGIPTTPPTTVLSFDPVTK